MLNLSQTIGAARRTDGGIARSGGGKIQIFADTVQSARIRKQRELQSAHLLRRGLPSLRDRHGAVGRDRNRSNTRRDRDGRLKRIPIGGHHITLRILVKSAAARVGGLARRQQHLEKSLPFDGQIERVAGRTQVALQLNDLGRRRTRAQSNLQTRGHRGLLRGGRARHHHALVDQVLELHAAALKASRAGVGQIVGDGVQIRLLRLHPGGGGVECSKHGSPPRLLPGPSLLNLPGRCWQCG